jgi:hypothetical protein
VQECGAPNRARSLERIQRQLDDLGAHPGWSAASVCCQPLSQGGKFLRRKPHSATGKTWFWFQFRHSDLIIRGTCMVKQTTSKTVLRLLLLPVAIFKYVTKNVIPGPHRSGSARRRRIRDKGEWRWRRSLRANSRGNSLSAHDGFNSSRNDPRNRAAIRMLSSSNSIAARLDFAHIVV